MLRSLFDFFSSLKLTIVSLSAALILIFVGTLAQVNFGIHEVQARYFQSLFVWWPSGAQGLKIPVFPGGHLIGAFLLLNLITAHLRRFRWSWAKLGIHFIHAGLIVMLAGGLFTDLFSVESFMRLAPGETKNYSEDARKTELAVIDTSDKDFDQVTAIPEGILKRGKIITLDSLPFRIIVRRFYQNSRLLPLEKAGEDAMPAATEGAGAQMEISEAPEATAENDRDLISAIVEISPIPTVGKAAGQSLGTWLLSDQLSTPQTFSYGGKNWQLVIRRERYYKPYSLTLQTFTHERYAGTGIAKNFASRATLIDPERKENRDVLIYMNHPLRYRGETFFQSGFEKNDSATVLQVVYNPSFIAPYAACVIVAFGLLFQFTFHFSEFLRRKNACRTP